MKPIKLGIIGCGLAAANVHWPNLQRAKDKFQIVAVCDPVEHKAKAYCTLVGGVPYETDHRVLLDRHDVEAVDVVVPIPLHYSLVAAALQAGKHVFVEKPIAGDLREGELMLQLDQQYPQVKMVGENFRYRRAIRRTKEIIDSGMIGKTYAAFCDFFVNIDTPENPYMQTEWRTHHEFPGGSISDAGIHWAAQLRCIFGDIEVKSAFAQGINPHIGKTDSVSFHFFNSRKLCGIANLFLSAKDYFKDGMVILGTEGSIVVDQVGTVFGNVKISTRHKGEATEEIIENDTGLVEEFTDFYQAIRTGTQVQSSFKEAYKDLKVILDALEASKSGDVASLMAFW